MRLAISAHRYRSGMPVFWMYNGHDKRWLDVSCCTDGILQVAGWLQLTFAMELIASFYD